MLTTLTLSEDRILDSLRVATDSDSPSDLIGAMRVWVSDITENYSPVCPNSEIVEFVECHYIGGVRQFVEDGR